MKIRNKISEGGKRVTLVRLILIFSCLCLLAIQISLASPGTAQPLRVAMQGAGFQLVETNFHAWTELNNEFLADEQLLPVVKQAMNRLGIATGEYRITEERDPRRYVVKAVTGDDKIQLVIMAELIRLPVSGLVRDTWQGYLVINLTGKENSRYVEEYNKKVAVILQDFGSGSRINTCLVGYLDGKLVKDEWLERIQRAFTAVQATLDPVMFDENVVSCTGYTKDIDDYVMSNGRRINLNIAMRYSETENRTYMVIGSPIITREY